METAVGLLIWCGVLWDGFATIILPRTVAPMSRLSGRFYRWSGRLWSAVGRRIRRPDLRFSFLAVYGPVSRMSSTTRPMDRPAILYRGTPMILDQINYESLLIPLNNFYDLHIGGPRRPVFFDIAATRPELRELDRNYPVIREELLGILPDKRAIPRYHELDEMQYNISARRRPGEGLEGLSPGRHGGAAAGLLRAAARGRRPCSTASPGCSRRSSRSWRGASRSRPTRGRTGATCAITSAWSCPRRTRRRSG